MSGAKGCIATTDRVNMDEMQGRRGNHGALLRFSKAQCALHVTIRIT